MNAEYLFAGLPTDHSDETIEQLLQTDHFLLERIVSFGQATPPSEWLEQVRPEWL